MIGLVARRGIAAVLALTAVMALTGCARVMQPGVRNPERVTITAEDEQAILALAGRSLRMERDNRFADVAATAITAAEAERAGLGDVELRFRIVPSQLAAEKSLFDATLLSTRASVSVPVLMDERRLAEFDFEKVEGRWQPGSTGSEAPHHDQALAKVNVALTKALGGKPDETRWTYVDGSLWLVAKREDREAAGLIDPLAYGSFGDLSVKLPPPGTVLTDVEFRALLATMRTPR